MAVPEQSYCPSPVLPCSLQIEQLSPQGTVKKSTKYKDCKLILGRNEFRDIILHIETPKLTMKHPISEYNLHKRFWKDGKATLHLKDQALNVMIANAPPNLLLQFLKVVSSKSLISELKEPKVSLKQRMMSNIPKTFDEISPVTCIEYETLRQRQGKLPLQVRNGNIPGSSPVSSKRAVERVTAENNENYPPPAKIRRVVCPVILNKEQRRVLSAVQSGQNIFFTGSAGTGKSFLLKRIVGMLPPDLTCITASTGIAACQIGGTTLHSFAGIGSGAAPLEQCISLASRRQVSQQWRQCQHLIIDEISMVDGEFFKKMEAVAQCIRRSDKPFGGIQLILCGDFLQLPPVIKKGEKRNFCFQSPAWEKCIDLNMELQEVKRQDDPAFINILHTIRLGRCNLEHEESLKATFLNVIEKDGIKATRLCTHKDDVDYINSIQLEKLTGESRTFTAVDSDGNLTQTLNMQTPVPEKLVLKKGAQVMLLKNLDVNLGLVNGARGVIVSFGGTDGTPLVKFACGLTREVTQEKWVVKSVGGLFMTRRQIPLKLAWAFSIHKSQGMTLDCVEMSLSKVFEAGQAYVALSRARNLKSLRILDFNTSCIRANPDVLRFYYNLKRKLQWEEQSSLTQYFKGNS